MRRFPTGICLALLAPVLLASCDTAIDIDSDPFLAFDQESIGLGQTRDALIVIRNVGAAAAGPIEIAPGPVEKAGVEIPGAQVLSSPDEIPTLNPGDSAVIELTITGADGLQAGTYVSELRARIEGAAAASALISFEVPLPLGFVGDVEIVGAPAALRQGDPVSFQAVVRDSAGFVVDNVPISWAAAPASAGVFVSDGKFVPYTEGSASIIARAGERADTLVVAINARGVGGTFSVVGRTAITSRYTSDLWAFGDVAYTGTWGFRGRPGDMMYAWDISGTDPVLTDSIRIEARTIDDVMIRADGELAVITHEYMDTQHAITLIDMSDPAHPEIAGEYLADIDAFSWIGVHNAWLEGDYAYIVVDGAGADRGLWIIDISDPSNPERVARFYAGSSFLHDVLVRDGLAFLSHWDAGLIILDVGNGIRGGSPTNPIEVSRIQTSGGQVHNAWYWPETGYVFIGEEDFSTPGRLHVVDASDLTHPVEVASMRISGDTPHNYWLDEERGILYTSWYSRGVQAVDVSGELRGLLELQGRIMALIEYDGAGPCWGGPTGTCSWAPQLHEGFVYVADMNSGLWKLQPNF